MLIAGLIVVLLAIFVVGVVIGAAAGRRRSRPKPRCPCGRYKQCDAFIEQQRASQGGYQPYPCGVVEKPEPEKSDSTENPPMRGYGRPPKTR